LQQPRKVELQPEGGRLSIQWDGGHGATYSARRLRLACRCATCEDEWSGARRLAPEAVPEDLRMLEVKPVGRYGLQIRFSDGHATGIYTFQVLPGLCECEVCSGRAPR
jgi:DUF971 family protein